MWSTNTGKKYVLNFDKIILFHSMVDIKVMKIWEKIEFKKIQKELNFFLILFVSTRQPQYLLKLFFLN